MIQWKQRLYAFLLRRVLGPFLDASDARKLYDSIDFSLQEGKFVLKDFSLNAEYLSERLAASGSALSIRKVTAQRLEICFSLRENGSSAATTATDDTPVAQSSLVWRAMKLGGGNTGAAESSLPAVSLLAEVHLHGVELELVPLDPSLRQRPLTPPEPTTEDETAGSATKNVIGSYVDAALSSLMLTLKLSNIHLKMCHTTQQPEEKETWVGVRLSSMTYKDLDLHSHHQGGTSTAYKTVLNKSLELSDITIHAGEEGDVTRSTVVAMAQGSGRIFFRMMEYQSGVVTKQQKGAKASKPRTLSQDIEVTLNHQVNFSLDQTTLGYLKTVAQSLAQISTEEVQDSNASNGSAAHLMECHNAASSRLKNPLWENNEADHEDLKAITGIMKQYREAYHLAENNQLRGGILVPSHAYIDDLGALEEDDAMTFDVFFDANDQSFYNAASALKESVMMFDDGDSNDGDDSIQTKLRMHLLSGCIKVNFRDVPQRQQFGPQEYVLVTMDDLNVNLSSTRRRSELSLSVAHFEIEDAQLDTARSKGGSPGTIDIESLLGFVSGSSDEYENEAVVSQAPCITLHVQLSKEQKKRKSVECNLALLPIEIMVRQRSLANLTEFAKQASGNEGHSASSPNSETDESHVDMQISFSCHCPSLTFSLPLRKRVPTSALFNRCGETLANASVREAFFGISLDAVDFQWSKGEPEMTGKGMESLAKFSFFYMLVFACAPVGDKVSVGARMQRTDLVLLNGRTEVDPYIPISLEYVQRLSSSKDVTLGRDTFPIVPTISSFKARQEDEDEELKIDRLLFSKLDDVDADSRKNLRGTDPQIAMVADAEKSDVVFRLHVPEIIVDLTETELVTIMEMLKAAKPDASAQCMSEADNATSKADAKPINIAFAVNVDQASFSLKQDFRIEDLYGDRSKKDRFSCLFAINRFRTHALFSGADLRHFRVVMHDMALYSALHPRIDAEFRRSERDIGERVGSMKQRIRVYKESLVFPILYRSQIFTPICQDAPSLLVDLRDTESTVDFTQRQMHVTLYHLTFRYDVDSDWIEKLKGLLPQQDSVAESTSSEATAIKDGMPSMTRLFVSVADCNADYTSSSCFEMASRSIVRLGDFRFSSNIMSPASRNQAYSLSLGDLSYHISNQRMSFSGEDMKLCRASVIMSTNNIRSTRGSRPSIHGTTAEALLREMGFIEVLGLDSMDAVVAVTDWKCPGRQREPIKDPGVTLSLTFGILSVNACKDSFDCFATTIAELQAKLTALTDDDITRIRTTLTGNPKSPKKPTSSSHPNLPSQRKNGGRAADQEPKDFFLLDGYAWTEVGHDPLRELEIPDGDEQVAGWYSASTGSLNGVGTATTQPRGFPGRIIHHHFPLHVITNQMGDGDMGASKNAGEGAVLALKSRLLVHKLAVKLRFFDGYDWTDKVTDRQKKFLKKNGSFAIEPIARAQAVKLRQDLSKEVTANLGEAFGDDSARIKRKVAIMADLLANDEKEEDKSPFEDTPLPEDRAKTIEQRAEMRRLSRKTKLYLQVSANGVTVRVDAYDESSTHRLASVTSASVSDMFIAETASNSYPVKMLGEWVNDNAHPRDTRFGTLMLKMITWKPARPITAENEVESDDCEVTMQLLPMRAIIDQRAIHFARAFFQKDDEETAGKEKWSSQLHRIPPPRFRAFRVKPWKLKVDYIPQKLDVAALREGSIVELINISPIDGMIITLSQVSVEGVVGYGDVMGGLASNWLQEIVSTQLHKFLANARPFEPITDVSQGVSDLVVLPYEAFKNGDDVRRAMSSGVKSLAETVTFQTLTTTSRLTEYAANKMATAVGGRYHNSAANPLPARPTAAPRGVRDVTGHAMESLARGFQTANYKVVIVPYREYTRHGAAGAATSVLRGIPVMVVAPMSGATEALSYTLLGARNALRPDIRREEEASRTGFTSYDV